MNPVATELEEARAAFKAATIRMNAALKADKDSRLAQSSSRVENLLESEFSRPSRMHGGDTYVLPWDKDEKFNPLKPETCTFGEEWLEGSTAVVYRRDDVERTRPTRVAITSGHPIGGMGAYVTLRHDHTRARLGDYRVAGLVFYGAEGKILRVVGDVPSRLMACASFK